MRHPRLIPSTCALLFAFAPLAAVCAEGNAPPTVRASVAYAEGKTLPLGIDLAGVRLTGLEVTVGEQRTLDTVLPPHGGQGRFSWRRYEVFAENPTPESRRIEVQIRLLDRAGAVIDEFVLDGRARRGRASRFSLRRLTLNYVVPLIDRLEVELRPR